MTPLHVPAIEAVQFIVMDAGAVIAAPLSPIEMPAEFLNVVFVLAAGVRLLLSALMTVHA
jgi:hypothetical protein